MLFYLYQNAIGLQRFCNQSTEIVHVHGTKLYHNLSALLQKNSGQESPAHFLPGLTCCRFYRRFIVFASTGDELPYFHVFTLKNTVSDLPFFRKYGKTSTLYGALIQFHLKRSLYTFAVNKSKGLFSKGTPAFFSSFTEVCPPFSSTQGQPKCCATSKS